jgi:hypothetical protein
MYNQRGLGDCFLLAFRAVDGTPRYMLIDCGIFQQTPDERGKMREVAGDIQAATGGHLHVVVATHEHWDHLAGFYHAQDIFARMQIDGLWLGWPEDPADPLAQQLRSQYEHKLRALGAAVARLQAAPDPLADALQGVLAFTVAEAMKAHPGEPTPLQLLRGWSPTPPPYRQPGEPPLTLPDVPGVRIYVLGPPRDTRLITRSAPRKGETYEEPPTLDELTALGLAALAAEVGEDNLAGDEAELLKRSRPFEDQYRILLANAGEHKPYGAFFHEHYGVGAAPGEGPAWRRIPTDWLAAAGQLALDLDTHTNNTSLVLAIELVASGQVLLFAADAQVGNWQSWPQVIWPGAGAGGADLTGQDLLARTVLYKVGHHGSHNATLRSAGLERMSPALVAMLPVDGEWARKKKPQPWKMPFPPLLAALQRQARGRVIRADTGVPTRDAALASLLEWDQFSARAVVGPGAVPLWYDYTVTE